jgi:hypothetical protein
MKTYREKEVLVYLLGMGEMNKIHLPSSLSEGKSLKGVGTVTEFAMYKNRMK